MSGRPVTRPGDQADFEAATAKQDEDARIVREMADRYDLTDAEARAIKRGQFEDYVAVRTPRTQAVAQERRVDADLVEATAAARADLPEDPFFADAARALDEVDDATARGVDLEGEAGWRADEEDLSPRADQEGDGAPGPERAGAGEAPAGAGPRGDAVDRAQRPGEGGSQEQGQQRASDAPAGQERPPEPRGEGLRRDPLAKRVEDNGQSVLPGAEASTKQAVQARSEAPMRGDAPQKGMDDSALFDPEARNQMSLEDVSRAASAPGFKDQLYSGTAPFDPNAWKWAFGPAAKYVGDSFRKHFQDFVNAFTSNAAPREPLKDPKTGKPAAEPPGKVRRVAALAHALANAAVGGADAQMRALADTLSPEAKATANSFLDRFFARSGQARGAGRTYDEAVAGETNKQLSALGKIIGPLMEDKAAMEAVARQVRSGQYQGKAGEAAKALSAWLKEMHAYQRAAGLEIGDIGRRYFPRVVNDEAVWRDAAGFEKAAARAMADSGMSPADAQAGAKAWLNQILAGGRADDGALPMPFSGIGADHIKGRSLTGANVDKILAPYLQGDPAQVLTNYVASAVRRAEFTRAVGIDKEPKPGAKLTEADKSEWTKLREALIRDGKGDLIPEFQSHLAAVVGANMRRPGRGADALSWIRTATTMATLEKATIASLGEPLLATARSGDLRLGAAAISNTIRDLFGASKGDAKRLREMSEFLGTIGGEYTHALNVSRWAEGDVSGKAQAFLLTKYFRQTGLEQFTRATRVATTGIGERYLRKVAEHALEGDTRWGRQGRFQLAELGVPKDKVQGFAEFLRDHPDMGVATLSRAMKGNRAENAEMYRTAILRFVDQTSMRPSAAVRPRWASTPLGAMVFQLNSYAWALTENVLMRPLRIVAPRTLGGRGENMGELTRGDRAIFGAQMALLTMAVTLPVGFMQAELRDALFGDPKKVEERERRSAKYGTFDVLNNEDTLLALSRSGALGRLDPALNMLTGVKYGKDVASVAMGPAFGMIGGAAQTLIEAGVRNSPRTNNAERKVARTAYDVGIEPAANIAMTALPWWLAAPGRQLVGHGAVKERFVSGVAGPEQNKRRVRE
jgi:hypothetical protein